MAEIMVTAYAQAHPKLIRLKKSFINVVAFCKSKKIKDMISNKIFTTKEKSLAEIGRNFATKTAIPVIPPNVKLFANLKK